AGGLSLPPTTRNDVAARGKPKVGQNPEPQQPTLATIWTQHALRSALPPTKSA
ncbi:unnamed protein product, partial [Heterosigma akashiwo]